MKQFNLQEFKKNPSRKIVTRDGKATARIICTDAKSEYPIIALLSYSEKSEGCEAYTEDGRFSIDGESNSDLFFATEKKEGYANLFRYKDGGMFLGTPFEKKEDTIEENKKIINERIAIVKLQWEE